MKISSPEYWDKQFKEGKTGWDIGYVSPPIKAYIDQLTDKSLKILIPGAGNAWEVEYLFNNRFKNTFLLDFSKEGIRRFLDRCPAFPGNHILCEDFFEHDKKYDLILEQTFFSSFPPWARKDFVAHINKLLNPGGKYVGLLFNRTFPFEGPPYGGTEKEYLRSEEHTSELQSH